MSKHMKIDVYFPFHLVKHILKYSLIYPTIYKPFYIECKKMNENVQETLLDFLISPTTNKLPAVALSFGLFTEPLLYLPGNHQTIDMFNSFNIDIGWVLICDFDTEGRSEILKQWNNICRVVGAEDFPDIPDIKTRVHDINIFITKYEALKRISPNQY
jgi:hypothetical protein